MQNQQQQPQQHQDPAGGSANGNPSFLDDAARYLTWVSALQPSRQNLQLLAGNVACSMKGGGGEDGGGGGGGDNANSINVRPEVAFLFLRAAARHLPSCYQASHVASATSAVASLMSNNVGNSQEGRGPLAESDMKTTREVHEIVEGVGHAVIRCSPRSAVSQSGILPALAGLMASASSASNANNSLGGVGAALAASASVPALTNAHVEFLQAAAYAEQYRYAERAVGDSWPLPTSPAMVNVRDVLRYYYLRGCVHLGCQNLEWAVRCFCACLVVPAETASAVAIAAYKKLILARCLTLPANQGKEKQPGASALAGPLQLPKAAPSCLSRFLSSAFQAKSSPPSSSPWASLAAAAVFAPPGANPEEEHEAMLVANDGPQQGGDSEGPSALAASVAGRGRNRNAGNSDNQSLGVKAYGDFVTAFMRLEHEALDKIVQDHQPLFARDENMGLIKQCLSEFRKRQVYYYSRIYSVLSLQDLSNFLQYPVPELRGLLMQLSMEKVWSIQIDDAKGLVHFPRLVELPPAGNEEAQALQLMELTSMVQKLDLAVSASPKYLSIVKNTVRRSADGAAAKATGPRGVAEI